MHRMIQFLIWTLLVLGRLKCVAPYSHSPTQYYIQTDDGDNRYFRYQTFNGQYRKEKRLKDGSVVGTYGWVDPTGLLRLFDYFANEDGYKIIREQKIQAKSPQSINIIPNHGLNGGFESKRKRVKFPSKFSSFPSKTHITNPVYEKSETTTTASTTVATTTYPKTANPPKLKFRPLFVSKRKKKPTNKFVNRRRQNFVSARDSINLQPKQTKNSPKVSPIVDRSPVTRKPRPSESNLQPHTSGSVRKHEQLNRISKKPPIEKFGFDKPGGKIIMNFDLGNQYRKEKSFPDGTVVGEHGYVDPFGILRITTYTSGPRGNHQAKKSYWVGTRSPA